MNKIIYVDDECNILLGDFKAIRWLFHIAYQKIRKIEMYGSIVTIKIRALWNRKNN